MFVPLRNQCIMYLVRLGNTWLFDVYYINVCTWSHSKLLWYNKLLMQIESLVRNSVQKNVGGNRKINTFLDNVIFSNEYTFHISDKVNSYNCRIWGSEKNPIYTYSEHVQYSPKLNLLVPLSKFKVYAPLFCHEKT